MKELKTTKTIEVTVYEATDGTQFDNKDECLEYEKTANKIIQQHFKELVINEIEGCQLTNWGNDFMLACVDECWYYALIEIKDYQDLLAAQMYQQTCGGSNGKEFTRDMIGKKIVVGIGEGIYPRPTEGSECLYNECYIYGTIEEQIRKYKRAIKKLEEINTLD